MSIILEPVDLRQCQAEVIERRSFALGGTHVTHRCTNGPTHVAIENAPEDGKYGQMSLCDGCVTKMRELLGVDYATVLRIKVTK